MKPLVYRYKHDGIERKQIIPLYLNHIHVFRGGGGEGKKNIIALNYKNYKQRQRGRGTRLIKYSLTNPFDL